MENTTLTHVKVVDRNSPLFDKTFKIIEQDVEFVIAEIKVGATAIKHFFVKSQVTPVVAPVVATPTEEVV